MVSNQAQEYLVLTEVFVIDIYRMMRHSSGAIIPLQCCKNSNSFLTPVNGSKCKHSPQSVGWNFALNIRHKLFTLGFYAESLHHKPKVYSRAKRPG